MSFMICQEKIIMISSHDDEWPCGVSKGATVDYVSGLLWAEAIKRGLRAEIIPLSETKPYRREIFITKFFSRATHHHSSSTFQCCSTFECCSTFQCWSHHDNIISPYAVDHSKTILPKPYSNHNTLTSPLVNPNIP